MALSGPRADYVTLEWIVEASPRLKDEMSS